MTRKKRQLAGMPGSEPILLDPWLRPHLELSTDKPTSMRFGMLFGKFVWNGTTVTIELSRQSESLKKAQLVTREVQMASAFAHRLFTRGHVKYVRISSIYVLGESAN
ncbi:hypothetical protein ALC53_10979 [Atta colombica]|uniref:Uncharacterized protein n=1 Tax=Atta colombica TaxID=520822 RepID=A0A195B295_9HYME|nr:hypothetical protein ALC53_10979 [Atta colombica]